MNTIKDNCPPAWSKKELTPFQLSIQEGHKSIMESYAAQLYNEAQECVKLSDVLMKQAEEEE